MNLSDILSKYSFWYTIENINVTDVIEIVILAFLLYQIMVWARKTRVWTLLKGFAVLLVFYLFAWIFDMTTIVWVSDKVFGLGITALVIVFQPELRKALEQLGQQNLLNSMLNIDNNKETEARFSDRTINEMVKAVFEMGKEKTGALIVIERNIPLAEYERTGIPLDSVLSSQLLINIFEHNTPLHDGAVIVRGDRIVSATCYLPLSDNMALSKELGTRHRAAVGVSEATDSFVIIVSEETGAVSTAMGGSIRRNLNAEELRAQLVVVQDKNSDTKKFKLWKGRTKHAKKVEQ